MYNALSVAKFVVDYCNQQNQGISNLKLQKVLYYIQAEFLVATATHAPCFSDTIEAWDFGPVVPAVYHHYKIYGSANIPSNSNDPWLPLYQKINTNDQHMIISMINATAPYSASQLVQFTHSQVPWKEAYVRGQNNPISNKAIRDFFEV